MRQRERKKERRRERESETESERVCVYRGTGERKSEKKMRYLAKRVKAVNSGGGGQGGELIEETSCM